MPRTARRKSSTGIYHIIFRGINRQTIFEDAEDSIKFLKTIKKYQEVSEYLVYAYCLMGNHIHLLLKEGTETMGIAMRRIGAAYVYWYNWKYDRCGPLFQDRYRSEVIEDDRYLLTVLRYIHQNPIKAGLVNNAADYQWSSYGEYIGAQKIVNTDFILELFGMDRKVGINEFKNFHQITGDDTCIDLEEKKRFKDDEAIGMIKDICKVSSCKEVQGLNQNIRSKCLSLLKEKGLSTRQIARLTGVSRDKILKV